MHAGTAFVLAKAHAVIDSHLWVVITDTDRFPDQVVIVSVTTYAAEKDQACIIDPHEHSWLTHRSCISYGHAKVVTLALLWKWKDGGSILLQDSVPADLLERIRTRSGDSLTLPSEVADILIEQRIIRLDG